MGHAIRMWSAVCSKMPHLQFGEGVTSFVHGGMESISPETIKLNPGCLGQAHSNRPGTGPGFENTESACILAVLRVPFIIRPLRSADA